MTSLFSKGKHLLWKARHSSSAGRMLFLMRERLAGYPREKRLFRKKMGYELDLKHPKSFNQKIVWKKLFDRDPLLPVTSDKYAVRSYIEEVLGKERAEEILVPLLSVTDDPSTIPFDTLPAEYIMKATHASGQNVLVEEGTVIDRARVIAQYKDWLSEPYGFHKQEWAYRKVHPRIIIEALLREDDGDLAQDYKFHVFHGKCRFIHTTPKVNGVRTGTRCLFTPTWELLDAGWKHPKGVYVEPPSRLADMVALAEELAAPFDYTRVDLYNSRGKIYFGELTHYHGSGMEKFSPQEFDFKLGEYWDLVPRYWKNRS